MYQYYFKLARLNFVIRSILSQTGIADLYLPPNSHTLLIGTVPLLMSTICRYLNVEQRHVLKARMQYSCIQCQNLIRVGDYMVRKDGAFAIYVTRTASPCS